MSKRKLQNENLDRIGRELLEAARLRDEEIERIVAAPQLFNSVKATIKAVQAEKQEKSFFGDWRILNWKIFGASATAFAAAIFCVGGLMWFSASRQIIENVASPETHSPLISSETPPLFAVKAPEMAKREMIGEKAVEKISGKISERNIETISVEPLSAKAEKKSKIEKVKLRKAVRKTTPSKIVPEVQQNAGGEFYALHYPGNPVESVDELQIVRANISRSELFALGVNLPIENESEKIKTDLLVGADGIPRAIRFVE